MNRRELASTLEAGQAKKGLHGLGTTLLDEAGELLRSRFKLTPEDFEQLVVQYESKDFTRPKVSELR